MDYAQSRLQARFGERPDEILWQKLEAVQETAAALKVAGTSGLRRWVTGIPAQADNHAIEIALRARWRECVAEIACWMPEDWQPAVLWTRGLVDLPALCYLARGGAPLAWMQDDPILKVYALADAVTCQTMLHEYCRASPAPLLEAFDLAVLPASPGPPQICQAWLAEWRRRWPRWSGTAALEQLASMFDAALKQTAPMSHPELLRQLCMLFRRSVLRPVVAFIYLACAALDIERLRAGLLKPALVRAGIIPS